MSSEQSNILKRREQINQWFESDTDKASNSIKEADKIRFPSEVQFLCACNSNDWAEIDRLLNENININCAQDDGLTALHQASIDDDENLVRFLLEHGAQIDVQDKEGWTPLFAAVSCNYLPITKLLISAGAKLDIVSFDGELPIDQSNNETMTEYLKMEMAKQNLNPDEIRNRERSLMLMEVEKMKQSKDYRSFFLVDNGATMLHVAASKDYTDVLEKLLSFITVEMLNHTDQDGWNALHVASHWNNRKACVMLVEADINFDTCTIANQTVLEVADDDVRPYLREEIRKARIRRQDKISVKRPAESPNGEYQPSETKIICPDRNASTNDASLINGDKPVTPVNEPISASITDNKQPNSVVDVITVDLMKVKNGNSIDDKAHLDNAHEMEITSKIPDEPVNNVSVIPTVPEPNDDSLVSDEKSKKSTVLSPSKSPETESQRKEKARHARSVRRSTQGISTDDLNDAKKMMIIMTNDNDNPVSLSEVSDIKENIPDKFCFQIEEPQNSTKSQNGNVILDAENLKLNKTHFDSTDSSEKPKNSDNSKDINQSELSTDSLSDADRRRRTGSHLVNKRRTRERPPTGTIELKDIQAAQKEISKSDSKNVQEVISTTVKPESQLDYKVLYEAECEMKDKLYRNLKRVQKELQQAEEKVKTFQSSDVSNNKILQNSSVTSDTSQTSKEIRRLAEENKKLKEANSALIRVISRLSHSPTKTVVGSS